MQGDITLIKGVPFSDSPFGKILLFSSEKLKESVALFKEIKCENASFSWYNDMPYNEKDLNVLNEINVIRLIVNPFRIEDCSAINSQRELLSLRINTYPVEQALDFNNFPAIEIFEGYWSGGLKNLFSSQSLQKLTLWQYQPRAKNIQELTGLNHLNSLSLFQSNIKNLDGIGQLKQLKQLSIGYNKNLEVFSTEENLKLGLEKLEIEVCKKLDLQSLRSLPKLKVLSLQNNGKLDSLEPALAVLPELENLNFSQTDLLNGDNSYLLRQPKLKKVYFLDKRHYKFTVEQINSALHDEAMRKKLLALS
jgi:hypothetical protein